MKAHLDGFHLSEGVRHTASLPFLWRFLQKLKEYIKVSVNKFAVDFIG